MPKDIHPNFLRSSASPVGRVLAGAVGIGVLGALVYTGTLGGGARTASIDQALFSVTPTPVAAMSGKAPGPRLVSAGPATALVPGTTGETILYYERGTGRAFSIDLKTLRSSSLSDTKLTGFADAIWANDANHVVALFDGPGGRAYRAFNYADKRTTTVGKNVTSAVFSPNTQRLAYLERSEDSWTLFAASADGSDPRRILETRASNPVVSWPQDDILALTTENASGGGDDLTLVSLSGQLTPLLSNQRNLEYLWSSHGDYLLYSYVDTAGVPQLAVADLAQNRSVVVPLATSAQKCAWAKDESSITCGVPAQGSLSLDNPVGSSTTSDSIIRFDFTYGTQVNVFTAKNPPLSVERAVISPGGTYFVFQNTFDHQVYSIVLP